MASDANCRMGPWPTRRTSSPGVMWTLKSGKEQCSWATDLVVQESQRRILPGRTGADLPPGRHTLHGQHPAEVILINLPTGGETSSAPTSTRQQAQHPDVKWGSAPIPSIRSLSSPHGQLLRRPHPRQPQVPAQMGRTRLTQTILSTPFGAAAQLHRRWSRATSHRGEDQHLRISALTS